MIEYVITRDQLKKLFDWINELSPEEWKRTERLELYTNLEVPELVRCRDCKHFSEDRRDTSIGWVGVFVCDSEQWSTSSLMPSHKVEPDGFCAWGERRHA